MSARIPMIWPRPAKNARTSLAARLGGSVPVLANSICSTRLTGISSFANDELKDNLNAVGRVYYSFSTLLCTPCSRSQEVAACLGAQAGEKRIREVVTAAGFTRFRRAAETPFNIVFEARP